MIRTRFAPSPTGYLHIGGVRTALFCWLFARRGGGRFILRIDDTDQQRNVEEALAPILDGLRWLGIDWDEGPDAGGTHGPYRQSERIERYRAAAAELLAEGFAYHDYATPEEIQAERQAAEKDKRLFLYSRRWMAESPADRARFEGEGRKPVVRLKMPREGKLVVDDLIRGRVEFDWAREQDHVIQRADGSCLYHLASTVDDHQMQISHVIRAEEHLSNTPRQVFIAQALGYELPQYAHLPYVAEPGSRNKLSKRKLNKYLNNRAFAQLLEHGQGIVERMGLQPDTETFNPVIVDFYRQVGYLPEAILNYLALLGWSLDDKTEQFTRDQLVRHFSLDRVNKAPASFDPQKLRAFQERHMLDVPIDEKVILTLPYLQKAGLVHDPASGETQAKLAQIVEAAGDRIKVAGDVLDYADLFLPDDQLPYDDKAFEKRLRKPADAVALLSKFKDRLTVADPFDTATLEKLMHEFVEQEAIKVGQIIHALRVAVTGKAVGFGMFETLAVLGRKRSVARIDQALARV
ncbi:MAG: glutamate--tRNA ligase [Planctomycetota bacterium]|jgi:glutamyl-tRNA synthetase